HRQDFTRGGYRGADQHVACGDPGACGRPARRHVRHAQPALNDCLIAASTREHGFVLVTRNTAYFARIRQVEPGVAYEAPWPDR
ncbi:MAG TPA: hypothetical protein VEK78_11880, partial [Gemmatimonadales bacterium]|nr:hypothetical protein [Gemmatimonadales bacterium]